MESFFKSLNEGARYYSILRLASVLVYLMNGWFWVGNSRSLVQAKD